VGAVGFFSQTRPDLTCDPYSLM